MHENELSFINGGEHIEWAPEIPIWLSLTVIVGTLVVTAVVSLLWSSRHPKEHKQHQEDEERQEQQQSSGEQGRPDSSGAGSSAADDGSRASGEEPAGTGSQTGKG